MSSDKQTCVIITLISDDIYKFAETLVIKRNLEMVFDEFKTIQDVCYDHLLHHINFYSDYIILNEKVYEVKYSETENKYVENKDIEIISNLHKTNIDDKEIYSFTLLGELFSPDNIKLLETKIKELEKQPVEVNLNE